MNTNFTLHYKNFLVAAVVSMAIALGILSGSFYYGKKAFFLMLNNDLGLAGDIFFNYFTYFGDGLIWIIWLALVLAKKRRHLLPLIISSFALTTIFTQVCKQIILPNEARPLEAFADTSVIHFIQGITVHSINSFPSGHTATAFTFALLIAFLSRHIAFSVLALLVACLVGYSRIYQGQHFPLDVGAGIIVAVVSVAFSIFVQQYFTNKKKKKQHALANDDAVFSQ